MAAPLSVSPTFYWEGNDGNWSTFWMRAGSPFQAVRLLPATSQSALWPVWSGGCDDSIPNCANRRGLLYTPRDSSTWSFVGNFTFALYTESKLGYNVSAMYGNDTVTFGSPTEQFPVLENQAVQTFEQLNFFNGFVGINNNYNIVGGFNNTQPSILQTLKSNGQIPSSSWSYTAGAFWTQTPVPGSLVLGGYDPSRLESNNVTIAFGADHTTGDLLTPIRSISWGSGQFLLQSPITAYIDSVVPHIWLPLEACQAFESALGITWDSTQQLYTLTDEQHNHLLDLSPTITFTIAASSDNSAETIDIAIPYAALDLIGSPPWLDNATRYFPLKRADSPDQYTLGRAFLQAAMVVTDYERSQFQIAQATFPSVFGPTDLVPILSPSDNSNNPGPSTQPKSSNLGGIIAGSVIGAVAVLIAFGVALWRFRVYLRNKAEQREKEQQQSDSNTLARSSVTSTQVAYTLDMAAAKTANQIPELESPPAAELEGSHVAELASHQVSEMGTPPAEEDMGRPRFFAKLGSRRRSQPPHELDGRAIQR